MTVAFFGALLGGAAVWFFAVEQADDDPTMGASVQPQDEGQVESSADDTSTGPPSDRADARAWARLAGELAVGGGHELFFVDLERLERAGLVDRSAADSADADIQDDRFRSPLYEETGGFGVPYLWYSLQRRNFEWPPTEPVLGFGLGDVDRVVFWQHSHVVALADPAPDVKAAVATNGLWSDVDDDPNAWRWHGTAEDVRGRSIDGIGRLLDMIRVDDDVVVLADEDTAGAVAQPSIELLSRTPEATFGELLDPSRFQHDQRPEPVGGHLDSAQAVAYTSTWEEDAFVHRLHLLWPDAEVASLNRDRLQATYEAGGALAELLGDGFIETEDRMVVLTAGPEVEDFPQAARRRHSAELRDEELGQTGGAGWTDAFSTG